jgi:hypothetical protein
MNGENKKVESTFINKETKQGVMDSLRQEHNVFINGKLKSVKKSYKKDWSSIRLSIQINLMVWELIPFNDHSIMTSRQAFVLRWLCFTLIGKKPVIISVFKKIKEEKLPKTEPSSILNDSIYKSESDELMKGVNANIVAYMDRHKQLDDKANDEFAKGLK